jgi:uncharacterized repeat protein (TIGR03833 family)
MSFLRLAFVAGSIVLPHSALSLSRVPFFLPRSSSRIAAMRQSSFYCGTTTTTTTTSLSLSSRRGVSRSNSSGGAGRPRFPSSLFESLEDSQEDSQEQAQKKKKKKKGFTINPNLVGSISSDGIVTNQLPTRSRPQSSTLGVPSRKKDSRSNSSGGARRTRRPRDPAPAIPPPGQPGRGCFRQLVVVGNDVFVVKKDDQRTGVETRGTVARHLTNSPYHPRGIKVMLTSGQVGRVTRFVDDE